MSWALASLIIEATWREGKDKKDNEATENNAKRSGKSFVLYFFILWYFLALFALSLSLFACSNKIKLKDFVEYVCENDHFETLKMGPFDVGDRDVSRASRK